MRKKINSRREPHPIFRPQIQAPLRLHLTSVRDDSLLKLGDPMLLHWLPLRLLLPPEPLLFPWLLPLNMSILLLLYVPEQQADLDPIWFPRSEIPGFFLRPKFRPVEKMEPRVPLSRRHLLER